MQKYRGMMLFMAALVLPLSACMTEDTVSQEDSKQMEQATPVAPVEAADAADTVGAAESLAGSAWWVEDINGLGVVDRSRSTIGFGEPGRVMGSTGCNRYQGTLEANGSALSFGPLAGTRRACPEALMNQEQKFFAAMAAVVSWKIDPDTGLLHLYNEAGDSVLRAVRLAADESP
ncbi:MAG: META domain-containing protein [Xanthomonadales bacterium]|nr:META domain-containing protein [Xanthomonadales bacterium]